MKKAIFIVEDIKDGEVQTLLEKAYLPLRNQLKLEGRELMWLSEITKLLYNHPSDFIQFVSAKEFIKNAESGLPTDRDVFYFISCFHTIDLFAVSNFLLFDPVVLDFLVKHDIPIIMDTSMETCNHVEASNRLFNSTFLDATGPTAKNLEHFYRSVNKLTFVVVGSTVYPESKIDSSINIKTCQFPGPFFQYNFKGSNLNNLLLSNYESIVNRIRNKKITEKTTVWQSFSGTPRINRTLFQLRMEHEGLTAYGRYSRLNPSKQSFIRDCETLSIDKKDIPYADNIDQLDQIKIIDSTSGGLTLIEDRDFMLVVTPETFYPGSPKEFYNSITFLTEKTAMAIFSGLAFIPLGGQHLGQILKSYGFREFDQIEFLQNRNFLDELNSVTGYIKKLSMMSVEEKQQLYDSWKETIVYNFNRYIDIDIKKAYLENLNKSFVTRPQR